MKSTEFLTEKEVRPYEHEELTIEKAVEMLNKYCKQSRSMVDAPLWRGFKNHSEEVFAAWPETGERKSQNTTNHYTEILANSPYMRGWPSRSNSFICSSSFIGAYGFAGGRQPHVLFPFDNVEIAVCPKSDLWNSTVTIPQLKINKAHIEDVNGFLKVKLGLPDNFAGMVATLRDPTSRCCRELLPKFGIAPDKLIPILFDAYSPDKLGFELMSIAEFSSTHIDDRECWVGGPVVAISRALFDRFKSAIAAGNVR